MVNKAILVGNLGANPEIRYTQNGTAVATLNLATTRKRKNESGQYVDETEWHRCVLWGKTAEYSDKYLHKGSKVYIEGRLQTRKWTDQQGIERYTTEVIVENLQSLTSKSENQGYQNQQSSQNQGGFNAPNEWTKSGQQQYSQPDTGDDTPF